MASADAVPPPAAAKPLKPAEPVLRLKGGQVGWLRRVHGDMSHTGSRPSPAASVRRIEDPSQVKRDIGLRLAILLMAVIATRSLCDWPTPEVAVPDALDDQEPDVAEAEPNADAPDTKELDLEADGS